MTRVDLHVKILDEAVVERAIRAGLDAIVYAPHFTRLPDIVETASAWSSSSLTVIPARECFTGPWWNRRHVLAIGLDEPIPDFLPLETTLQLMRDQEAAILAPHPTFLSVSLTAAEIVTYRDWIDAVEVYNPKHLNRHNRRARSIATELALPGFGSSYAHLRRSIGHVWTEFTDEIEGPTGLVTAIKTGSIDSVGRRKGIGHQGCRVSEFAHLGWENSWIKIRRLLSAELEATHPHHPAYAGQYAEDSVYR